MKKVCFVKLLRHQNPNAKLLGGSNFSWEFIGVKPFDDISEMVTSFDTFKFKIDSVQLKDVDTDTSIVLTLSVIDLEDSAFLNNLKYIFNKDCKKIFIDLSSYDNQDVHISLYDWCRKECQKELYFIDKNLIKVFFRKKKVIA